MTEESMGKGVAVWMAVVTFSAISALVAQSLSRAYILSSILAAICVSATVQIISFLVTGYLDPLAVVAFFTVGFVAFVVALIVGLPFRAKRIRCEREQTIRTTILSDLRTVDNDPTPPYHVIEDEPPQ